MEQNELAYCGIVCSVCKKYLQLDMPCLGCKGDETRKSNYCKTCGIVKCEKRISNGFDYCDKCSDYNTCEFVLEKETRYLAYPIPYSPKQNLKNYRKLGYRAVIDKFDEKYFCKCGAKYSVQKGICPHCQSVFEKDNNNKNT